VLLRWRLLLTLTKIRSMGRVSRRGEWFDSPGGIFDVADVFEAGRKHEVAPGPRCERVRRGSEKAELELATN
jgi:hypothetical protein